MANGGGQAVYAIEDILPVLTAVLQAAPGQSASAGTASKTTGRARTPQYIGPSYLSNFKTRKGQLTAGITSLIGNTLIANRAMGNPIGLPWWLGGESRQEGINRDIAETIGPQVSIDTRRPQASGRQFTGPPPTTAQNGGGMMGLDIGKLLTSIVGGGGGGILGGFV